MFFLKLEFTREYSKKQPASTNSYRHGLGQSSNPYGDNCGLPERVEHKMHVIQPGEKSPRTGHRVPQLWIYIFNKSTSWILAFAILSAKSVGCLKRLFLGHRRRRENLELHTPTCETMWTFTSLTQSFMSGFYLSLFFHLFLPTSFRAFIPFFPSPQNSMYVGENMQISLSTFI